MNRIGIIFLVYFVPALALLLATLGATTLPDNPLGWFLLLVGLLYTAGTIIVYAIQKKRYWESAVGGKTLQEERGSLSFWLIAVGMMLVFFISPLEYLFRHPLLPHTPWMIGAGAILVFLGVVLFAWARRTLRKSYSGQISVTENQPLVQNGPYRIIRHPAYLGYLCMSLGVSLGYSSLGAVILFGVVLLPAMIFRIRVEEKILLASFGEPFKEYASRTKRLIPGIW